MKNKFLLVLILLLQFSNCSNNHFRNVDSKVISKLDSIIDIKKKIQFGTTFKSVEDRDNHLIEFLANKFEKDSNKKLSPLEIIVDKYKFSNKTLSEIPDTSDYIDITFILTNKGKIINFSINDSVSDLAKKEIKLFIKELWEFDSDMENFENSSNVEFHMGIWSK